MMMVLENITYKKKTKARELGITKFPYEEYDKNGNLMYIEWDDGTWVKREFDDKGNITYRECNDGHWRKTEYDKYDNKTYLEWHDGHKIYYII